MTKNIIIEEVLFHRIDLEELNQFESLLPSSNIMENSEGLKLPITEVVMHWNASSYSNPSHHYQIQIALDTEKNQPYILLADKNTFLKSYMHSHTWKRNTGRIGISFVAMYDQKKYPVTESMIHLASEVLAIICKKYNLHPQRDILDHKHFADIDGYPGERWDTQLKLNGGETVSSRTVRYTTEVINRKSIPLNPQPKVIEVKKNTQTPTVFKDVFAENWYSQAVIPLHKWDILAGYKDKEDLFFYPDKVLVRELAFVLLSNVLSFFQKQNIIKSPNLNNGIMGNDEIAASRYAAQINLLNKLSLITGDSTGKFNLDAELTRAEFSALVLKVFDYVNNQLTNKINISQLPEETFLDVDKNHWAYNAIETTYYLSVLIGYKEENGHYFKPDNKLTRAEFSASIYKFISFFKKKLNLSF